MTLKAVRYIQMCSVLAAPCSSKGESFALDIAAGAVDLSDKHIVYLDLPMTRDADTLSSRQRAAADCIAAHLDAGADVAVLSLGDASLYSSYSYLCQLADTKRKAHDLGVPVAWASPFIAVVGYRMQ